MRTLLGLAIAALVAGCTSYPPHYYWPSQPQPQHAPRHKPAGPPDPPPPPPTMWPGPGR